MFIGQSGVEKSGNYLVYRILREILIQIDCWNSYSKESNCWSSLFRMNNIPLSFPEQRDIDEVFIKDDQVFLKNSHLKASFRIWDLEGFERFSRLIWTHQAPMPQHHVMLGKKRRWFYVLRDGRDVVNSWMHYAVSPRMLQRHPQYKISKVDELYDRLDVFKRFVERWVSHIEAYLALRMHYFSIRFEDLVENKDVQIKRIVSHLGISDQIDIDRIMKHTSKKETKAHAPQHIRRAQPGEWASYFGKEHKKIFNAIGGEKLALLGYLA